MFLNDVHPASIWFLSLQSVVLIHHAETDAPQLHGRRAKLRPDDARAHAGPARRVPRPRQRVRPPEAHRPRGCSARGRAEQTRPGHVRGDVPGAFSPGPSYRVLHQLPAEELFLRFHALRPLAARGPQLLQMTPVGTGGHRCPERIPLDCVIGMGKPAQW